MTVQPLLLVPAPAIQPYRYGLASVVVPADGSDPHSLWGVQYEQIAEYLPGVWPGACYMGVPTPNLNLPGGVATSMGLPFSVYAGVNCSVIGYDEQYILSRAQAILKLGWQNAAETAFWGGLEGNIPYLTSASVVAASGVSMTAGVSALEDYLGHNYLGVGIIHAPRAAAPYAKYARQIVDRSNDLQTILGTRWCFGGGYLNTGPGGSAAPANTIWMYATGLVTARLGAPFVNGGLGQNLSRLTNIQTEFAEQQTVLTVDGPIVAVSVDVTK